jgi:hypothetical protein
MNASHAMAKREPQIIDGRFAQLDVVEHGPLAIRMTAIDTGAATGASEVVLTVPSPSLTRRQREALRERFRRLEHLAHPNIPGFCFHGACCVSDRVDGESLADVTAMLAPDLLEQQEVDRIVRTVGSALAAAHRLGISHGALALDRVMVTPELDLRLIGLEVGDGRLVFDPAADIAALAGMAAELHGAVPVTRDYGPTRVALASRETRGRRRPRAFRVALLATFALAVLAVDPGGVARLLRDAVDATADAPAPPARAAADAMPAGAGAGLAAAGAADTPAPRDLSRTGGSPEEPAATTHPAPPSSRAVAAVRPSPVLALPAGGRAPTTGTLRFSVQGERVAVSESAAMARLTLRTTGRHATNVIWWLAEGSARPDSDYADLGLQSATIPPHAAIDIVVPLVADAIAEGDEDFEIFASVVEDGRQTGVPVKARVRILDDD